MVETTPQTGAGANTQAHLVSPIELPGPFAPGRHFPPWIELPDRQPGSHPSRKSGKSNVPRKY